MSPQPQIVAEINQSFYGRTLNVNCEFHKHNFGQTLKLQSAVVTLNIRSRSFKFT